MLRLILILGACAASAHAATAWKLCDEALTDAVRVEDVQLSPFPAVRGQPLQMSIRGTMADAPPEELNGGQLEISVLRSGHNLYKNSVDLCSGAASCSSSGSEVTIGYTLTLPHITPTGSYEVKLTGEAGHGGLAAKAARDLIPKPPPLSNRSRFFCVDVDLSVVAASDAAPPVV